MDNKLYAAVRVEYPLELTDPAKSITVVRVHDSAAKAESYVQANKGSDPLTEYFVAQTDGARLPVVEETKKGGMLGWLAILFMFLQIVMLWYYFFFILI